LGHNKKGSVYQKEKPLSDGRTLQIIKDLGYTGSTEVRINNRIPEDGFYFLSQNEIVCEIIGGKIKMEYYIENYKQENGNILQVGGSRMNGVGKNSPVWLHGNFAPNGEYKKGWFSKIKVKNGRIK
jgi:hypothetical protein